MKLDKVTRLFLLTTAALLLYGLDMWLGLMGGCGLSLIVTIFTVWVLNAREGFGVTALWIFLGSLFFGGMDEILFTAAGGLLAYASVVALRPVLKEKQIWIAGCLGTTAFFLGRLLLSMLLRRDISYLIFFPLFAVWGVLFGTLLGLITQLVIVKGNDIWKTIFK